ncbi:MAG TPA: hypothetical protein VFY82_09315 [Acidimicrobiales bacterium]|nr:hypothetical protein [Acidimicrobiales bacterium]
MAEQNRVTPFGDVVAIDQRGLFLGNRGSIHRGRDIVRPWQVRRWITCVLSYKDWVAPVWAPGRWTALFFWDEAVALAAGHRPCALCRHADHVRWLDAWEAAHGERPRVDPMDRRLHAERVDGRAKRTHAAAWGDLPDGAFAVHDDAAVLVLADRLVPWSPAGYGPAIRRPAGGRATVLTPPSTLAVLGHGYRPVLHPTAS